MSKLFKKYHKNNFIDVGIISLGINSKEEEREEIRKFVDSEEYYVEMKELKKNLIFGIYIRNQLMFSFEMNKIFESF